MDRSAKRPRWKRYLTRIYLQTDERAADLSCATTASRSYIVTGGGRGFVRVYSEATYGIPPEQVVGTAEGTTYTYGKDGQPVLTKVPKLLLNDNNAGKPEGIHLMIGRRPIIAVGNSTGDRQMLEYTEAGEGPRLAMLVLHDDAEPSTPMARRKGFPIPNRVPSPRIFTTKPSRTGGSSSA